jgi:hypothetical protein
MASAKSTEPPKKKVKLLEPEQIPEVILDTDSDESEDDSTETVDREEDYEFDESDQSLLQHEQAPSQSSYTGGSSAATANEMPHSSSPPGVSEEEEEQNEPGQQTVQQEASSWWTLTSCSGKNRVHGAPEERRAMKRHTSITAPVHLTFSCCFSQKLSLCWWLRLTNTITIA